MKGLIHHHQINKKNNCHQHQHQHKLDNSIYFTSLRSDDLEQVVINQFKKFGFPILTNIQKLSLKVIVRDYDSLLVAPTGSGKTEAAIVPIIKLIKNHSLLLLLLNQVFGYLLGLETQIYRIDLLQLLQDLLIVKR